VVRHGLARPELQELAQRQAVGAAPSDAALALQALEVADQQHPEIASWRNPRPPDTARVGRRAQGLDLAVEAGLVEQPV
jgi:hypothetical protein